MKIQVVWLSLHSVNSCRTEVEKILLPMRSLHQALASLNGLLRSHPSVLFICPLSVSLGRHLGQQYRYTLPITYPASSEPGSALIVCNSINRPDYEGELEDVKLCLEELLRMKVRTPSFSYFHCRYQTSISTSNINCKLWDHRYLRF